MHQDQAVQYTGETGMPGRRRRPAFKRLVTLGFTSEDELEDIISGSGGDPALIEKSLTSRYIPKLEILRSLSEHHHLPFLEFSEALPSPPREILDKLDLEELKHKLWFPLSFNGKNARVAVCDPGDTVLRGEISDILGIDSIAFILVLPSDLRRMIEHRQDVNPGFPPNAGRTPLAGLRTHLAGERTIMAWYRTSMAKARTGLALMRTGVGFIIIGLTLLRIFGIGYMSVVQFVLVALGVWMSADGLSWYLPMRRLDRMGIDFKTSQATFGTSIPELKSVAEGLTLARSNTIDGAEHLRRNWARLSPVMKRRFLAIDRTDLAEERTVLANYRTIMARTRTGLAFTRTGVAFAGLGIVLLRQFPTDTWMILYMALIAAGIGMFVEGASWYPAGRKAERDSFRTVREIESATSIWDFMFRYKRRMSPDELPPKLPIEPGYAPGIWGTTGLALERTLIAERRNVKARLRTALARSRTGLSFMRTGSSIFSVGIGLFFYFGWGNLWWTAFDASLMVAGVLIIIDGLYWHLPAERVKRAFPYCFEDLEIRMADFSKPSNLWDKAVITFEKDT